MSSSESEGSDDVPDSAVCEQLCQTFAEITGTDTALAMYFLQNRRWELQNALNGYYEEVGGKEGPFVLTDDKSEVFKKPETAHGDDSKGRVQVLSISFSPGGAKELSSCPPTASGDVTSHPSEATPAGDLKSRRIRLLSWNIDGLDENNIQTRTKAACAVIKRENPDVVFLQEVVPVTLPTIEKELSEYLLIPANYETGYFTAVLLKRSTAKCESREIIPFFTSRMGRNLLSVEAKVHDIPFLLMTSHLESTKTHNNERIRQLKKAFEITEKTAKNRTVIFGGDLNLRDKELSSIGGTPENVYDIWELTGKRKEAQYTWDTVRNDNLGLESGKYRAQLRFDRLYIRFSEPQTVKPVYFELVGIERIPGCRRFPSDHWGILTHYDKLD